MSAPTDVIVLSSPPPRSTWRRVMQLGDFPVVQGVVILGGIMIVSVNFVVDILYAVIDPRIRLER